MQRDMDLIRKILLALEKEPFDGGWVKLNIDGFSDIDISYHLMLLNEAGLIDAEDVSTMGVVTWKAKRLAWQGHEFLEAARDENRWKKAKKIIQEKGGGIALTVIKELLLDLMKKSVLQV